jgi:hypothetical protein
MTRPTSLRLPADVRARLERHAAASDERAASLAVRLIDEGLRMSEHPGIVFRTSPLRGRVAALAKGPEVAEVVSVLSGLESTGQARLAEAAEWLALDVLEVRIALSYYAAFPEEVDDDLKVRATSAAEARDRYEVERTVLG